MKSQALAIAMVIASGIGTYVMSLSTLHSLQLTRATFYRDYRFAEAFASLKRAPESLRSRIAALPGVQHVETRVVAYVNLDIEGYDDPASAHLISLGHDGESLLNQLYLKQGRLADPLQDDEVVASEAFVEAQGLQLGDEIAAIINGRRKRLRIVGTGISPEYIYQIRPGALMPDFESYAILWMPRRPLATAYNMDGAFNDVSLTLTAGASVEDLIQRLDRLLERYGGRGAYARADQVSHRYLNEEFRQLDQMATVFPVIFLGVAAFLLNVVFSRLFQTQREEIATLRAFGYPRLDIGIHYMKFVVWITLFGVSLGLLFGVWLGRNLSEIYMDFYRFPFMRYVLGPGVAVQAALVSLAAALSGTLFAIHRATSLPPAEAMRPEPPARYHESLIERMGLKSWLSQPARMIVRNIQRRPLKALLSATGIALSYVVLMLGMFSRDSIDYMVDIEFRLAKRDDLTVTFTEPASYRAIHELRSLPGVEYVEPFRSVPVRLRHGHRSYRTAIEGLPTPVRLRRLLGTNLRPSELPPEGIVLTDYLANEILQVRRGELLTVEVLEGARSVREVPVAGLINEFLGVSGYMRIDSLNRLLREGDALSGAYLATDAALQPEVYQRLKETPRVAATTVRQKAIQSLYETMGETMLTFAFITTLLAGTIAFGVVYNSARISLSERGRELASLRVLGFTRGEVSFILLGELAVLTLAATPLGFLLGRGMCAVFVQGFQTDLFRIPLVLEPRTYAISAATVIGCSIISGLIVRRRLDRLDLVAVLKSRE